jgi:hypothetical protein
MLEIWKSEYAFFLMFVDGIKKKSKRLGRDVCLILFLEESFETNLIVIFVFVFVMIDCIFVSECRYRLIVDEFGIRLATW